MKHLRPLVLAAMVMGSPAGCASPAEVSPEPATTRRAGVDADKIRAAVSKLDGKIQELGGSASIAFVNVATGEIIAAAHEHDPKNPASNSKLATTAAALTILGPGHRFTTGLYGDFQGSTVPALVLRGRGDPTLSIDDLSGMVRELRALGVKKVQKIWIDQSYFDDKYVPPAFDQQPDEWSYFRAPTAAVSLDENTITIWVRSTKKGDAAIATVNPPGFVDLSGSIETAKKDTDEKISCGMSVSGDHLLATLDGHIPEDSRLVPIVKRVDDPRRFAGYALRAVLREQGVEVGDGIELGGRGVKEALVVHSSRPLGEIVMLLGKESDNFAAEMLLRATGEGKGGTTSAADGADAVTKFLDGCGALDKGMKITNGSGLFDANRSTAFGVTKLLVHAYEDPAIAPEFVAQLSIAGVDGTLKHRMKKWADKRVIRAKTGTLAASIALSGYVLAPDGGAPIAFSILANDVRGKGAEARDAMDASVEAVATELWRGH